MRLEESEFPEHLSDSRRVNREFDSNECHEFQNTPKLRITFASISSFNQTEMEKKSPQQNSEQSRNHPTIHPSRHEFQDSAVSRVTSAKMTITNLIHMRAMRTVRVMKAIHSRENSVPQQFFDIRRKKTENKEPDDQMESDRADCMDRMNRMNRMDRIAGIEMRRTKVTNILKTPSPKGSTLPAITFNRSAQSKDSSIMNLIEMRRTKAISATGRPMNRELQFEIRDESDCRQFEEWRKVNRGRKPNTKSVSSQNVESISEPTVKFPHNGG
jgi:hypothetical protein